MQVISTNTVFHVTDLDKSIDFYVNYLGFKVEFKFGEPSSYAGLSAGNARLHLSSNYPYKNNTGHGNIYLIVDDADAIFQKLEDAGANFYSPIDDRDYGLRDFAVKDPDDNQIGIGSELK